MNTKVTFILTIIVVIIWMFLTNFQLEKCWDEYMWFSVITFFVIGTIVGALIGGIFCCIIGNDAEVCFPMGAGVGAVVGFFGSGFLMEIIGACKK